MINLPVCVLTQLNVRMSAKHLITYVEKRAWKKDSDVTGVTQTVVTVVVLGMSRTLPITLLSIVLLLIENAIGLGELRPAHSVERNSPSMGLSPMSPPSTKRRGLPFLSYYQTQN